MKKIKIYGYIEEYKKKFQNIHEMELYKWQAIKTFQENFNIEEKQFHQMLRSSLSETQNLMSSTLYYPRKMILQIAKSYPEDVRNLFRELYNQENDRIDRIESFQKDIKEFSKERFPDLNNYQDHRAVIVYLCLRYPNDNYFYKFRMFKEFSEKIKYDYSPKAGRISNVTQFYAVCENIREILTEDKELIRMHNKRLSDNQLDDKDFNILTQDYIYAVAHHLEIDDFDQEKYELHYKELDFSPKRKVVTFNAIQSDHLRKAKRNKYIGDLGELLVLEIEKENVANEFYSNVLHQSRIEGDGLGYDIISVDEKGIDKFIEVKTTTGPYNTPFFITKNELEKSIIEKDKYFLYRLYNFDIKKNSADYFIINGSLLEYCINPTQFEVHLTHQIEE